MGRCSYVVTPTEFSNKFGLTDFAYMLWASRSRVRIPHRSPINFDERLAQRLERENSRNDNSPLELGLTFQPTRLKHVAFGYKAE